MKLYTIGFTKKSAQQFFEILKANNVDLVLDVRINNKSQLAGFTKSDDLEYFLKQICGCSYKHGLEFAPTKNILENYRDKKITWEDYEKEYTELLLYRNEESDICDGFTQNYESFNNIALLCSEATAEKCHRRLAAEIICRFNQDIHVINL